MRRVSPQKSPRGLTLIELTVSMAIVAVLFAAVVTGVGAITGANAKGAAGELGGVIRSLYDTAALTGKTCRLVFQLPPERSEGGKTRYWAECAAGNITTRRDRDEMLKDTNRESADAAKRTRPGRRPPPAEVVTGRSGSISDLPTFDDLMSREKGRAQKQEQFQQFTTEEIRPRELPGNVQVSVWTLHQREPAKNGLAYLYFFPQGFTEKAMVFVKQGNNAWTITVAPLTGKTTVVGEELEVPRS